MSRLHICLFGKCRIQCSDQEVIDLESGKVQELLCYLLLHRDRPHAREVLAGLLWGDNSTVQSKKYLRHALWQLQTALESDSDPMSARVLLVEPDWVSLNARSDLWLDIAVFERASVLTREVSGRH